MALNLRAGETTPRHVRRRLPGPDVVRSMALIGVVVMNFHGYLMISADVGSNASNVGDGWAARLFDPWSGPLATRFAATFVLVAGVGVTLLTRSSIGDRARTTEMRRRLVRRGVLLYTSGLLLDLIWAGTIIPYYGAMFVVAATIFTLRSRWIIAIGISAALGGSTVHAWLFRQADSGHDTDWLTSPTGGSVRGYLFDVAINGTHPLLPWLAFLCAGMILGRALATRWWRIAALGGGAVLYSAATLLGSTANTAFQRVVVSTEPGSGGVVYVAGALGTALVAYGCVDWLADRFPDRLDPLRRAGRMTLTLYVAHILVFNTVVHRLGWIEPAGLDVALLFALGFWILAVIAAAAWQRRFGLGPAERFYRAFGG